jgi:hypothetical protein
MNYGDRRTDTVVCSLHLVCAKKTHNDFNFNVLLCVYKETSVKLSR